MNNVSKIPAGEYRNSSEHPIRFDRLHPGSLFRIHAEPSRNIYRSSDKRVYRKAQLHEGFFAKNTESGEAAVLLPFDLVQPVVSTAPRKGKK